MPLDRPVYQVNEAARLLRLPDKTLRRWLDGDRRFDRVIEPVIRPESTGSTVLTWGEFVEAGLLSVYRHRKLPLERLRPLIAALRVELKTLYPLAHGRPLYSDEEGRQLVWRLQRSEAIEANLYLVVEGLEEGYQLVLSDIAEQFVSRVEFEPPRTGVVAKWYPGTTERRRIALDPRIAFGLPTISGIRTEVLAELSSAGEPVRRIVRTYADFGITAADVEDAIEFEQSLLQAA